MTAISAVLIAQNEERNIADALASVAFCDEIILVDSGSDDRTRAIAEAGGARVVVNAPWPGFVAQRDFAVRAAKHDWVLALDADERVSDALREEIESLRAGRFGHAGYRIPRVAYYLDRWIRGTDWYPDWQVRFFDRTRAAWQGDLVHESVRVDGPVGRLQGELEHHPYSDMSDHLRKIDSYTTLWAEQANSAGRRTNIVDMVAGATWAFLRNYLLKRGFVLGSTGFVIAVLNTHYTFVKLAKLRELERDRPHMSLRVVHLDSAATWRGGQNQVFLTARGMAARGHQVIVGCRRGGPLESRARAEGLDVRPIPFRGDLWPPAILSLARTLRRERPSVLLLHDPHAVSAGLLAARLAGGVRLVAVRRVDFALRGMFSRWKYAACDRVIVVSSAIGRVVEAGGLDSNRVRLVYEGVPDRSSQPGGREILESLGVPAGAPVVGNVAALTGHKDHATLVEAMALLRPRAPEARLVIAGEGELRSDLETLVRERGLGDRVLFAGFRRDLDRLLPAFSIFCLSSHLEGLGTSVLDAMAFGLPVVATAAGGIPEAVQDGVTGRVVPPRNPAALAGALAEVLGDEEHRRALATAGRQRFLECFTDDHMVEATTRVIEELA